jgi:hypothetical protein
MLVRVVALIALVTGCLYTDPINQRPSIAIVQDSSAQLMRGGELVLHALPMDPDGDPVFVSWRFYACTDATTPAGCDQAPFALAATQMVDLKTTPVNRLDNGGAPVESLRVILDAQDIHGAVAKPSQELVVPVGDAAPTLELSDDGRYGFVTGTPVAVYAKVGDPDDDPAKATVSWQVIAPAGGTFTLADLAVMPDPNDTTHVQYGKTLVPTGIGAWDVRVVATDPAGVSTMADQPITVVADHPPCLDSYAPLTAPVGQALPMPDPTLFQVLVVGDDLDPYPPIVGDAVYGTPTFSWSLLPPGATTRQPLSVIGNSVALDPANYAPGDVLELRVEIADRQHTPINCADAAPTCSVISDPTCIQRLTWRVEVQ